MTTESWVTTDVTFKVHTENDGPRFLSKGAEAHDEVLNLKDFVQYCQTHRRIREQAIEQVRQVLSALEG